MEAIFLKLKLDFNRKIIGLFILFSSSLLAQDALMALKDIKFKEKVTNKNVILKQVNSFAKNCTPLTLQQLENESYTASHYIFKDSIICVNDVIKYEKESVVFDFGPLQIEQEGKIIYENDQYIRIKKSDGTIEKIYKNGKIE